MTLFIIVILGYILRWLNYLGGDFDKKLSALIIDVTCPLLILSSVMGDQLPDRSLILPLLGVGVATYVILCVVAFTVPRLISKAPMAQGMIGFAMMFGNVGFIGYCYATGCLSCADAPCQHLRYRGRPEAGCLPDLRIYNSNTKKA